MRNSLLLLMVMFGLWCCQKEDSITPELKLENLYEVKNNASDSIQQRVYDIYEQYKVTVVFNDTIGKVFVKMDVNGDSVFTYETVDPAYSFTGYTSLDYEYTFLTDPTAQSQLLDVVESYLSSCNRNLYPQVILLTNAYSKTDQRGTTEVVADGDFDVTYRSLLLSYTSDEEVLVTLPNDIMTTFIKQRITDYSSDLLAFHQVSKDYIGKSWSVLGVEALKEPVAYLAIDWISFAYVENFCYNFSDFPFESSCSCLQDDWWGFNNLGTADDWYDGSDYKFTLEQIEAMRDAIRQLIGPFGFVSESEKDMTGMMPPVDEDDDLNVFMREMLRFSREEFETLWGDYPLVMQKYDILYDLLTNEFGVEL